MRDTRYWARFPELRCAWPYCRNEWSDPYRAALCNEHKPRCIREGCNSPQDSLGLCANCLKLKRVKQARLDELNGTNTKETYIDAEEAEDEEYDYDDE